nr:rhodanese-like domain-containing protein [Lachnospiraceae bacterium]
TGQTKEGDGMTGSDGYRHITQDEAKQMMEVNDGHVIVDVRREDEYAAGHIPGAILIPNETIEDIPPEELSDPEQIILVYCRTGRRSKEAAGKLAAMGYSAVYEFGGILDWTGEVVTGEGGEGRADKKATATLTFETFDGGGPEFRALIDDPEIVAYDQTRYYGDKDHDNNTGSSCTVEFSFTGLKPGKTKMRIEERSPIADNLDREYDVSVGDDLKVTVEEISVEEVSVE